MEVKVTGIRYCAACYGQHPDRLHVDFGAAYDGPVIGGKGDARISVDDLIICENCLTSAAKLLRLGSVEEVKKENKELGELVDKLEEELTDKDQYVADLTASLDAVRANPPTRHNKHYTRDVRIVEPEEKPKEPEQVSFGEKINEDEVDPQALPAIVVE